MKKLATVYRDSCRELKQVRTITTAAMFMAVSVVLGYFTIEAGPYLKIGFGSVVNQFVYFLFGPVVGGFYGGVLDLVKYVVKPTGAFFPGFTFNAILAGIIYGTFLYQRPLTFKRTLAVHFIVIMVCNVFLNTLFLSMMSGKGILALNSDASGKEYDHVANRYGAVLSDCEEDGGCRNCEGNPEIQTAGCESVNRRTPM